MDPTPVLEVRGLQTYFFTDDGAVKAVDGVSFEVGAGETLGIVGESGCGKSVTSLSILRLIPSPPGKIVGGEIRFMGQNLLDLPDAAMRKIRGNEISMIFQEPMTSLNPVMTIGAQISETIRLHEDLSKAEAAKKAVEMLRLVKIPEAAQRAKEYPHQLSGGMRQRAMIAMALALNPKLLIADEPTTALDVTVQAQIIELIDRVKKEFDIGVILITHDLGVVAETATHVMVMYAGRAREYGTASEVFNAAQDPYTWGLLESMPSVDRKLGRLVAIEGSPPSLLRPPPGCAFHPRCPKASPRCAEERPELALVQRTRAACWWPIVEGSAA